MGSSPRFRRGLPAQAGTSVIAALVFAAILGAIALSLNAWQANSSANTQALSADVSAPVQASGSQPVNSYDQVCQDGVDFDDTLPATYTATDVNLGTSDQTNVGLTTASSTVCESDQQATADIQAMFKGLPASRLPAQQPLPPKGGHLACTATGGKTTTGTTCLYIKQPDGVTYKLQNWTCYTRVVAPGISSNPKLACEIYFSQPGETTNPNTLIQNPPPAGPPAATPPTLNQDAGLSVPPPQCLGGTYDQTSCVNSTFCQNNPSGTGCGGTEPYTGSGLTPGTDIPQNCNANNNATTIICGGSNSQQAAQLQDNTGYSCAYNPSNQTSTCTASDQGPTPPTGGQPCTGSNCTPAPGPAGSGQTQTTGGGSAGGSTGNGSGGLGNTAGLLGSFLSGLIKGITPCTQQQQQTPYLGGTGSTLVPVQVFNPTTGTYSTTYVQQPVTSPYGTQSPCQQQQSPYGTGSDGAACAAPPAAPQCAAGATAEPTSAAGNGCVTGYQCVPTSSTFAQTPTPQISCSPQTADVGQTIAISYSCQNATGSSGGGFSTNNQISGSATSTITAPPTGTNTANYGLTCTNNGQIASAQCSVQIDQPAIDLVADPQSVQSGATASIGWVTAGMQSCVVSSPQDQNFTNENAGTMNVNGVAQTDPITQNTEFDLTCMTLGGQTKTASTNISVGTATSSVEDISVSSNADGQSVNHGSGVTITWNVSNATSNSALALWLIDLQTEQATALIAGNQSLNGSYTWALPASGSTCDQNSLAPCASQLVAGDSYGIEAAVYTPQNAYLGVPPTPSGDADPTYTDYGYTATPFTIGQ